MARRLGLGIVGCVVSAVAAASAKQYGVRADTVDGLLAADDVDIVVNLTIPAAHHEVSRRALDAGKHVSSSGWMTVSTTRSTSSRLARSPPTSAMHRD